MKNRIRTKSGRLITYRYPLAKPIGTISPEEKIKIYDQIFDYWEIIKKENDRELAGLLMFNFIAKCFKKEKHLKSLNENWDELTDYDLLDCKLLDDNDNDNE